jgi:hypothetical protein
MPLVLRRKNFVGTKFRTQLIFSQFTALIVLSRCLPMLAVRLKEFSRSLE